MEYSPSTEAGCSLETALTNGVKFSLARRVGDEGEVGDRSKADRFLGRKVHHLVVTHDSVRIWVFQGAKCSRSIFMSAQESQGCSGQSIRRSRLDQSSTRDGAASSTGDRQMRTQNEGCCFPPESMLSVYVEHAQTLSCC